MSDCHDEMMDTSSSQIDPLWTVIRERSLIYNRGRLPAYCERLEATGRGWAIPELNPSFL